MRNASSISVGIGAMLLAVSCSTKLDSERPVGDQFGAAIWCSASAVQQRPGANYRGIECAVPVDETLVFALRANQPPEKRNLFVIECLLEGPAVRLSVVRCQIRSDRWRGVSNTVLFFANSDYDAVIDPVTSTLRLYNKADRQQSNWVRVEDSQLAKQIRGAIQPLLELGKAMAQYGEEDAVKGLKDRNPLREADSLASNVPWSSVFQHISRQ